MSLTRPLTRLPTLRHTLLCQPLRFSSTEATPPPLLAKLRTDLKTAMRAKDTPRLNVLRALLADVTNAAKSPNPVKSDMQLLSLLRKRQSAAAAAKADFQAAGREDLVEKEEAQVRVLEEYAGGVETMGREDVLKVVKEVVAAIAGEKKAGVVMKELFKIGGALDGKNVEKSMVPGVVKEVLGQA